MNRITVGVRVISLLTRKRLGLIRALSRTTVRIVSRSATYPICRFIDTYRTMGRIGFNVISLHDARSRGNDIVLIDFGSDIGGYSENSKDNATINEKAQRELDRIRRR